MMKEIRVKPLEADNKEGKIMAYIFFFHIESNTIKFREKAFHCLFMFSLVCFSMRASLSSSEVRGIFIKITFIIYEACKMSEV